jgi:hypothetical protein
MSDEDDQGIIMGNLGKFFILFILVLVAVTIGFQFVLIAGAAMIIFYAIYVIDAIRWLIVLSIKFDLFLIYACFRLPIFIFIQVPLAILEISTVKIARLCHAAISSVTHHKLRSGAIMTPMIIFEVATAGLPVDLGSSPTTTSFWMENLSSLFWFMFGMIVLTMFVSILWEKLKGVDVLSRDLQGLRNLGADVYGEAQRYDEVAPEKPSIERNKLFDDLDDPKKKEGKWSSGREDKSRGLKARLADNLSIGDMKAMVAGLMNAMNRDSSGDDEETEDVSAAMIVGFVIFSVIVVLVQAVFVLSFAWAGLSAVAGGPVGEALGISQDYVAYYEERFSNQFLAGRDLGDVVPMDGVFEGAEKFRAQVGCALKGPACLRQWRLNNTERPDSNDVGETYSLDIEEFNLGSGSQLDIADKRNNYSIPISYSLSNDRRGLKGIAARDINYNVRIIDDDSGRQEPLCETGYYPVPGFDLDSDEVENDLPPGTSASTEFLRHKSLNLSNCELTQPGAGIFKTGLLDVKYDYFSQATLNFEVMSLEEKTAREVNSENKNSKTFDSPVKAALQTNDPAVYERSIATDESESGYAGNPIAVRATLNADQDDISFKVRDLALDIPDRLCVMDEDRECMEIDWEEGEFVDGSLEDAWQCSLEPDGTRNGNHVMVLTDQVRSEIIQNETTEKEKNLNLGAEWFDDEVPPDIFGCAFGLKNPAQVTPTGESFLIDIRTNYTVRIGKRLGSFEVLNTRCREINCPMIDPLELNNGFREEVLLSGPGYIGLEEEYKRKQKAKCRGSHPDAGNGCTAVNNRLEKVDNDVDIRQGEIAVNITRGLIDEFEGRDTGNGRRVFSCEVYNATDEDVFASEFWGDQWTNLSDETDIDLQLLDVPTGLNEDELQKVFSPAKAIHYTRGSGRIGENYIHGWKVVGDRWLGEQKCWESGGE